MTAPLDHVLRQLDLMAEPGRTSGRRWRSWVVADNVRFFGEIRNKRFVGVRLTGRDEDAAEYDRIDAVLSAETLMVDVYAYWAAPVYLEGWSMARQMENPAGVYSIYIVLKTPRGSRYIARMKRGTLTLTNYQTKMPVPLDGTGAPPPAVVRQIYTMLGSREDGL